MKANIKILVLHSRLSGYWMACMRTFVEKYGGSFSVVRKETSAYAPFNFENQQNIQIFNFSSFSQGDLLKFCKDADPDLIYVAGWSEQVYLDVCQYFYNKGVPIVCGLDNHWQGTLSQQVGKLYLKYVKSKLFTHVWIAGLYQFEFARQLGFSKESILTGVYSADVDAFLNARKLSGEKPYPRSFLYVGRFIERKGLMELAQAFQKLNKSTDGDWSLTLIGNGPLKKKLKEFNEIKICDFVQPEDLPEVMSAHGVFLLPSLAEPWGVVIHEAAAAGLPIISTKQCGAATAFIRDGYNGFLTEGGDVDSLYVALESISRKSDAELYEMGERSVELSRQYTPQSWSSTLYQLIKNNR